MRPLSRSILRLVPFLLGPVVATAGLAAPLEEALAAPPAESRLPEPGIVAGTVVLPDGSPVADATVEIVTLHRRVKVDADGHFRFDDVPVGSHVIEVTSLRQGSAVAEFVVDPGSTLNVELGTALTSHRESIVVSASPTAERLFEVGTSADVLGGDEIAKRGGTTLGATLANQAGVHQTFFGAGASRPIVRGLGGDRVRMLESGVGTGDLSEVSPDHAVTAEAGTAEQIEILRGPATLLYGSSAIGGVVNVIDETIPSHTATEPISGTLDLRAGSAADEFSGTAALSGGAGPWAWSFRGLARETDDYEIPGFARLEEEHEHDEPHEEEPNPRGVLPNSATAASQLAAGASYFFGEGGEAGFVGLSVAGYESDYGIPEGAHEHEGEDPEAEEHAGDDGLRVDMERLRYDLKAAVTRPFALFDGVKARFGLTDYEHDEIEPGGEIGSHFENDAWEGRVELVQRQWGPLTGAFGVQGGGRDFEVVGEEAFLPRSDTRSLDLFAYEEVDLGDFSLQFGGRWATREIAVDSAELRDRDFDGASGSVGVVWSPAAHAFGVSLARSTKFPSPEELYSDGTHVATQTYELGNPALQDEASLGIDAFYRYRSERLRAELSVFHNDFSDFIHPARTGDEIEGLPVVAYRQQDAEFRGAEAELGVEVFDSGATHVHLNLSGDVVRAKLDDGSDVPQIPPLRLGGGFEVEHGPWSAEAELRWTDDQNDIGPHETPTRGSTVLNVFLGYRLLTERVVYDFLLRGSNLTDEEIRLHTSYLKDLAPLPGRDLSLNVRLSF